MDANTAHAGRSIALVDFAPAQRECFFAVAASAIWPLQDAVAIDDATLAEVALLKEWRQYRVAGSRVDLVSRSRVWTNPPA